MSTLPRERKLAICEEKIAEDRANLFHLELVRTRAIAAGEDPSEPFEGGGTLDERIQRTKLVLQATEREALKYKPRRSASKSGKKRRGAKK